MKILFRLAFKNFPCLLLCTLFLCKTSIFFFLLFFVLVYFLYAVFKVQVRIRARLPNCFSRLMARGPITGALLTNNREYGGDKGSRTPDLLLARQALSQLSYAPTNSGSGPED